MRATSVLSNSRPAEQPNMGALALAIAGRGIPVFPCGIDKKPACRRGFYAASVDPETVQRLFRIPAARLIAVPTGPASGVDILDVDPRHDGHLWLEANAARLPKTRTHRTPSGGVHLVFHHHDGVRNSQSRIAGGVDVRGEGGYAVIPPSAGYTVVDAAPPAVWPEWLLVPGLALDPPKEARPISLVLSEPIEDKRAAGYVRSILGKVAAAQEGQKHDVLVRMGRALGGVMASIGLSEKQAVEALVAALPDTVEDKKNARRTAEWAVSEGKGKPFQLADRDRGGRR